MGNYGANIVNTARSILGNIGNNALIGAQSLLSQGKQIGGDFMQGYNESPQANAQAVPMGQSFSPRSFGNFIANATPSGESTEGISKALGMALPLVMGGLKDVSADRQFGLALRDAVPQWASNKITPIAQERWIPNPANPNQLIDTAQSLIPKIEPLTDLSSAVDNARKLIRVR